MGADATGDTAEGEGVLEWGKGVECVGLGWFEATWVYGAQ